MTQQTRYPSVCQRLPVGVRAYDFRHFIYDNVKNYTANYLHFMRGPETFMLSWDDGGFRIWPFRRILGRRRWHIIVGWQT